MRLIPSHLPSLLIFCAGFLPAAPTSAATPFVNETVDAAGVIGGNQSLKLDSQGNPHISYYDETNSDLKYARKAGGAWSLETVDAVGIVGHNPSIELDSQGNPHISYRDVTNGDLKYARKAGGAWSLETVDAAGDVGLYTSLQLDTQGTPHISYYESVSSGGDLKYAHKTGGTWSLETVDAAGTVGPFTSLELDDAGNPHISYNDFTNGRLKYAHKSGGTWSLETVDAATSVGEYTSLELDDAGNPHISYFDALNEDLKYASKSGGIWNRETVDAAGMVGKYTSLELDTQGNPHISYLEIFNGTLKYAHKTGGTWSLETVDAARVVSQDTSLELDAEGKPHISYYDYTNGDLVYADSYVTLISPLGGERWISGSQQTIRWIGLGAVGIALSADGGATYNTVLPAASGESAIVNVPDWTTGSARVRLTLLAEPTFVSDSPGLFSIAPDLVSPWWFTTPDSTLNAGLTTSIALDDLGNPHISHFDGNYLRYVEKHGGLWSNEIADSTLSGLYSSLAIDDNGEPHMSHQGTAGRLRYTRRKAGVWASEEVDGGPDIVGAFSSLALGAAGDPYISYQDATNGNLKVAHKNGSWSFEIADNSGNVGGYTSLALDALQRLYIAYYDQAAGELRLARSEGFGAGFYELETVDTDGDVGTYASLALDGSNALHIAYYDATLLDLKYAVKRNGVWAVERVDMEGDVGSHASLALDAADNPIITYYDGTNARLKVARRIGGTWWKEMVGLEFSGWFNSVAVDADGAPRIAYHDFNRGFLQYASAAVELSNPSPDDVWPVGAARTVRWDGTGRVDVLLSVDGGNSFQLLAERVTGGSHGIVVPHQPSKFAQIRVERVVPRSRSTTPGLFTIQTDILLLALSASPPSFELGAGALITWETDPGPGDLAGYRLDKRSSKTAWSTMIPLTQETSYHDASAVPGAEYRLYGVNGLGEELLLGETSFGTPKLLAARPLPYRGGGDLQITFVTGAGLGGGTGSAVVTLHDLQGRLVRTLARGEYPAGTQTVTWNGNDDAGRPVGAGMYFLRSVSAGESNTLKVMVIR